MSERLAASVITSIYEIKSGKLAGATLETMEAKTAQADAQSLKVKQDTGESFDEINLAIDCVDQEGITDNKAKFEGKSNLKSM